MVCDNLRYFRRIHGFSQRNLAEKSGVNVKTICHIEKNRLKTVPHPSTLTKLVEPLGIRVKDLYQQISH